MESRYDVAVVGGGIVGLAVAYRLSRRHPDLRLVLLEKEDGLACHQTGRNSGVIHSGLYYKPGSAKARLSVGGAAGLKAFCARYGIPFAECGKVVVAVEEAEIPRLDELLARGLANGVPGVARIDRAGLERIEPHAAGIAAVHVPSAGIVDYREVAAKLGALVEEAGGSLRLGVRVERIEERGDEVVVRTRGGGIVARHAIACAGLQSDRLARRSGAAVPVRIVPFRGEYFRVVPSRAHLVRGLIYPVPDPTFPFLGVHLTRRIDGEVEAGPNAVLALHREGYGRASVRLRDAASTFLYPGFWKLATRHWRYGFGEMARSMRKGLFVRAIRRLVPEIEGRDLERAPSGIRGQALGAGGELLDDFRLEVGTRTLHVLNAPSPAATAALAIADEILDLAARAFGWKGGAA